MAKPTFVALWAFDFYSQYPDADDFRLLAVINIDRPVFIDIEKFTVALEQIDQPEWVIRHRTSDAGELYDYGPYLTYASYDVKGNPGDIPINELQVFAQRAFDLLKVLEFTPSLKGGEVGLLLGGM